MWYCGVNPGPEQVGRIAPMIVVDMDRLRWDFCSCPACELAVERCERFDGLCRLADAYVEDTNRKVRQQYPDLDPRRARAHRQGVLRTAPGAGAARLDQGPAIHS
jgi:hypothetical protein